MKKFLSLKVWILIIALAIAIFAINPTPYAEGFEIHTVDGLASEYGVSIGEELLAINGENIESLEQFNSILFDLDADPVEIVIVTDLDEVTYEVVEEIGFVVDENLTILSSELNTGLNYGETIVSINGNIVSDSEELREIVNELLPKEKVEITTDVTTVAYLGRGSPQITIAEMGTSNIKLGLDLKGGTRVMLQPISETEISDDDINTLIQVMTNRLNVYGLSDLTIRSAEDWENNKFILIEMAGVSNEEIIDLIGEQGIFEAKIGEETVFVGGKDDIPFVCQNDGSCSGVRQCNQVDANTWSCSFEFVIHLTSEAAMRHAEVTDKLDIVLSADGREILSEKIDFYLDGQMVDSLQIGADLKGSETTQVAISGPGAGSTKQIAVEDAVSNMNKLQTILITGSLPFDIEIVKLDTISPRLSQSFINNALLVGFVALLAVAGFVFLRYRKIKIILPMLLTSFSELVLILGFAAFIQWNLDMAAIAGIIAAIGTGVDHQIVIIDEVLHKKGEYSNWKKRIKQAFFIIFVAYATTIAAMIPLWNAGAGLIRGFAVTTIIGVTIGVFLTRPAFAAIIEKLYK